MSFAKSLNHLQAKGSKDTTHFIIKKYCMRRSHINSFKCII